jgi:hypothetical protein
MSLNGVGIQLMRVSSYWVCVARKKFEKNVHWDGRPRRGARVIEGSVKETSRNMEKR